MCWHAKDFIQSEQDEIFFGAIVKAIYHPSQDSIEDVNNVVRIFKNYRHISLLDEQILVLTQLIEYKSHMLMTSDLHYAGLILEEENEETRILLPSLNGVTV